MDCNAISLRKTSLILMAMLKGPALSQKVLVDCFTLRKGNNYFQGWQTLWGDGHSMMHNPVNNTHHTHPNLVYCTALELLPAYLLASRCPTLSYYLYSIAPEITLD